ncbi:XRE family transcriptional regulator [Ktedonosporobacter rubrisoli]|uniref:XRE family transcriptional regulator n=1 Tax=Ktedonosporobacter rubrisoli TaxID=2509675 RepID=A0A4P6JKA5_KTERU|nr:helix-turn-helix transcriptional regulator [Ktedonosporobacter rubrisoli]QBD75579.1 XRE family transcriptional regulator [Ktedonosporobacter rubrisoli]
MLRLRVKEVACEKHISMSKLSQRSEVSYNIIRDIFINPLRSVNTGTLNRIAAALGVPATTLLEDAPGNENSE